MVRLGSENEEAQRDSSLVERTYTVVIGPDDSDPPKPPPPPKPKTKTKKQKAKMSG